MSNTVTSAFIDLATYDELEKYAYNGPTAVTYFVKCVKKCTWFSMVPVPLTQNGVSNFDTDATFQISRAGDYLIHTWLRVTLPKVEWLASLPIFNSQAGSVRWCNNIGHNLIDLAYITFNDLKVQEFDSFWLDMWSAQTVTDSKKDIYYNMIGSVSDLIKRRGKTAVGAEIAIPDYTLNIPLPFFFTRDIGISLPTAALPYNEMRIVVEFRRWQELLIFEGEVAGTAITSASLASTNLNLTNVQLWANYAVVSNEERVKMGKCPRDIYIEQVQRHGGRAFNPIVIAGTSASYDVRFSHSIKALFWTVSNTTTASFGGQAHEWSNYTTECGDPLSIADPSAGSTINGFYGEDPISKTSLLYENTYRLFEMGSDYFTMVQPWYFWQSSTSETGYHSYSYSYRPYETDPMGSTNFGKLTNVSLQLTPSQASINTANGIHLVAGTDSWLNKIEPANTVKCTFQVNIRGLNNNVVRVSGGALGLPIL